MKHYRVLFNGENFLINLDEKPTFMGFYTTRFVSAVSPEEAELSAIKNIQSDDKFKSIVLNTSEGEQPMIYMDEIEEVQENQKEEDYGIGWYKMDGSDF